MKANKFQIGDFVLIKGKPARVESLTKRKVGYHLKEGEDRMHYVRICEIDTIEISPEILNSNGFVHNQEDDNYRYDFISGHNLSYRIHISYIENKEYYNMGIVTDDISIVAPVRYIHELQHALNFCRINKEVKL